MKSILFAVLFVTVALAAADNLHVHLHLDKPITDKRFSGFVNKFAESVVNKNKNMEVHFHIPGDAIEEWGFKDIGNVFKDLGNKVKDGVVDAANTVKNGVVDAANTVKNGVVDAANTVKDGVVDTFNKAKDGVVDASNVVKDGVVDTSNKVKDGVVDAANTVKDGVVDAANKVKDTAIKGFDITKEGIEVAIRETEGAFKKVKNEIEHIKLPKIDIGDLIEPIINIAKIVQSLIPCAMSLKKTIPHFMAFAKSAGAEDAAGAVAALLTMLQFLPEISEKCLNRPFNIPPETMSKIQCGADIVALAAIVVQFIAFPENVIGNAMGLKSMIEMIPRTISDCTGAFA